MAPLIRLCLPLVLTPNSNKVVCGLQPCSLSYRERLVSIFNKETGLRLETHSASLASLQLLRGRVWRDIRSPVSTCCPSLPMAVYN